MTVFFNYWFQFASQICHVPVVRRSHLLTCVYAGGTNFETVKISIDIYKLDYSYLYISIFKI